MTKLSTKEHVLTNKNPNKLYATDFYNSFPLIQDTNAESMVFK